MSNQPRLHRIVTRMLAEGQPCEEVARFIGLADAEALRVLLGRPLPGPDGLSLERRHALLSSAVRAGLEDDVLADSPVTRRWVLGHPRLVRALFELDQPAPAPAGTSPSTTRPPPDPPTRAPAPCQQGRALVPVDRPSPRPAPSPPPLPSCALGDTDADADAGGGALGRELMLETYGRAGTAANVMRDLEQDRRHMTPDAWAALAQTTEAAWAAHGLALPGLAALRGTGLVPIEAALPAEPLPPEAPPPPEETLEQQIERLVAAPAPVRPDDVAVADTLVSMLWFKPAIDQGGADRRRVQEWIAEREAHHRKIDPKIVTRLASRDFADAARVLTVGIARPSPEPAQLIQLPPSTLSVCATT